MRKLIKETLNEKVFAELFAEIKGKKVTYHVCVYWRRLKKSKEVIYEKYEKAEELYNIAIK